MNAGVVVLARADSRRLPAKVLADVAGRPLLARVIARAERMGLPVIVATSTRAIDEPVADLASAYGAHVYRGPVRDVLARLRGACHESGLDVAVRVSGDSPFWDPEAGKAVLAALRDDIDLSTNVRPRSYPVGCSAEAIPVATLHRLEALARTVADREHVTLLAYHPASGLRVRNVSCPIGDLADLRLVVDDSIDLARARWVAARVDDDTPLTELVAVARAWPAKELPA